MRADLAARSHCRKRLSITRCMAGEGEKIRAGRSTPLYQPEYHMKTMMQCRSARPSAVAAAAVLAFWFTFASAQVVRAEDSQALAPAGQDMVLVQVKTVETLEQRVIFLEESVAALTESWQHIDTHRMCISDDGGAETCITKAQLDVLLTTLARAKISQPAVSQEASAASPAEPLAVVATNETAPSSEAATVVGENLPTDQVPEITGSVKPAATGAAVLSFPKVEIYEEPAARLEE
jgi:hypothetical protein